ncbi:hypothetical protein T12_15191 [Trichinella patagoniensis]|uniref:Uncharacterized protein n=1 Tax=Trichinella patagoniensis TaxID=990121 RepID=A0A0V0Z9Y2_9BILA|nr:hypothetical protein T12_15191 [Trichinella patagoniensis]
MGTEVGPSQMYGCFRLRFHTITVTIEENCSKKCQLTISDDKFDIYKGYSSSSPVIKTATDLKA